MHQRQPTRLRYIHAGVGYVFCASGRPTGWHSPSGLARRVDAIFWLGATRCSSNLLLHELFLAHAQVQSSIVHWGPPPPAGPHLVKPCLTS